MIIMMDRDSYDHNDSGGHLRMLDVGIHAYIHAI